MRKIWRIATTALTVAVALAACEDRAGTKIAENHAGGVARIGVILPDLRSSDRWQSSDPKFFEAAFKQQGVAFDIANAEGDKRRFEQIANDMLASGVRVLIMVNVDSAVGKTVIDKAHAHNVPVIDYDRLTLGGGADYYVGFDDEEIGRQQARGLIDCLNARGVRDPVVAELNGSPDDYSALLLKQGYDSILQPLYDSAEFTKGPDQFVPDWDIDQAHIIFQQMLVQQPRIDGVLAANDGLGNQAVAVLNANGRAGEVPVTGQDATVKSLQNILAGKQCMTVYKAIKPQAELAASLATNLFKGKRFRLPGRIKDPQSGAYIPFLGLTPVPVNPDNMFQIFDNVLISRSAVCTKRYLALCKRYSIV